MVFYQNRAKMGRLTQTSLAMRGSIARRILTPLRRCFMGLLDADVAR
jgi:hypothetical protein